MEVTGEIKVKGETQTFGNNGFQKRQLVIKTDEQYPQFISIDFVKDKCSLLDKYNLEDNVTVSINLGGREWTNPKGEVKYFNSVTGWRIEKTEKAEPIPAEPIPDDLPF